MATTRTTLEQKLNHLLVAHRREVFGPSGDAHERAIRRLKATKTARAMFRRNEGAAIQRLNARLDRQGY